MCACVGSSMCVCVYMCIHSCRELCVPTPGPLTSPGWRVVVEGPSLLPDGSLWRRRASRISALIRKRFHLLCICPRRQDNPVAFPLTQSPVVGSLAHRVCMSRRFSGHCMSSQTQVLTAGTSWLMTLGKGVNPVPQGLGLQRGWPPSQLGLVGKGRALNAKIRRHLE